MPISLSSLDYLKAMMIAFETDIHAVAGLLKRYFRELPDPLFTDELYVSFVQALGKKYMREKKYRREAMRVS